MMQKILEDYDNIIEAMKVESVIEILISLQNSYIDDSIHSVDLNKMLIVPILSLIDISLHLRQLNVERTEIS